LTYAPLKSSGEFFENSINCGKHIFSQHLKLLVIMQGQLHPKNPKPTFLIPSGRIMEKHMQLATLNTF